MNIPHQLAQMISVLGFGVYIISYSLLTFNRLTSQCRTYFVLNIFAASCVLIGLNGAFNLAAAVIQGLWIVTSIVAIVLRSKGGATQIARA